MTHTYLPSIASDAPIQAQATPVESFVELWMQALGDRAIDMRQDERLMTCAQLHADYLASRTGNALLQSMHLGEGGSTPNERVYYASYRLPDFWLFNGNQVECCVRCGDDREPPGREALRLLLASPAHRAMMLREDWYVGHICYGVGFCGSDWTIVACPLESGE